MNVDVYLMIMLIVLCRMVNASWYYGLENVCDLIQSAWFIENGDIVSKSCSKLLLFACMKLVPHNMCNFYRSYHLCIGGATKDRLHCPHNPLGGMRQTYSTFLWEMMVTLHDFATITSLLINGDTLNGKVEDAG